MKNKIKHQIKKESLKMLFLILDIRKRVLNRRVEDINSLVVIVNKIMWLRLKHKYLIKIKQVIEEHFMIL